MFFLSIVMMAEPVTYFKSFSMSTLTACRWVVRSQILALKPKLHVLIITELLVMPFFSVPETLYSVNTAGSVSNDVYLCSRPPPRTVAGGRHPTGMPHNGRYQIQW